VLPPEHEQPHTHPDNKELKSLSRIAADVFIKASAEYQAMAIAQAVRIQLLCREQQRSADELLTALLDDSQEVERVVTIANTAHGEARKHATSKTALPEMISRDQTLRVIRPVFALAIVFEEYTTEQLQHVMTVFYPEYLTNKSALGKAMAEKIFNRKTLAALVLNLNTIHVLQIIQQG
jgi:hypothetical protein